MEAALSPHHGHTLPPRGDLWKVPGFVGITNTVDLISTGPPAGRVLAASITTPDFFSRPSPPLLFLSPLISRLAGVVPGPLQAWGGGRHRALPVPALHQFPVRCCLALPVGRPLPRHMEGKAASPTGARGESGDPLLSWVLRPVLAVSWSTG